MESLRERVGNFLRNHGVRLNTDLGQHFLVDEEVLDMIVRSSGITPDDHIVEIGPGIGVLTNELIKRAEKVTAIELDERMIPLLKNFLSKNEKRLTKNMHIIHANALHTPFPETPYKIVANIPYHITSPLLRHAYLESSVPPTAMTLLIQREVAEKICDEKHAGILTIMVKLFGTPHDVATVKPGAFLPPPKVDSAVLHIVTHAQPIADRQTIDDILRLLKIAFAGKRKMLRNTIGLRDGGMAHLASARIDPTRRPETLAVEEWIALARSTVM